MTTYVALLYSIILSPARRLVMSDLRAMAEALGFTNVRTLVATGNLVFETPKARVSSIETMLETAFEKRFGNHVDILVRDADGWRKLTAANPFPDLADDHPDCVGVRVMRRPLAPEALAMLEPFRSEDERIEVVDGDPWFYFSREPGSSKLLSALGRKPIGVGTSRNWNTVRGICRMLG